MEEVARVRVSCREDKGPWLCLSVLVGVGGLLQESPARARQPPLPRSPRSPGACSCCWEMGPLGLEGEGCDLFEQTFSSNKNLWSSLPSTRWAGALRMLRSLPPSSGSGQEDRLTAKASKCGGGTEGGRRRRSAQPEESGKEGPTQLGPENGVINLAQGSRRSQQV